MSKASLGGSQCTSRVGENCQRVERYIPTYTETVRNKYKSELYEKIYMYDEDDLEAARERLGAIAESTEDLETIKALYTARACVVEEIKRRNQT